MAGTKNPVLNDRQIMQRHHEFAVQRRDAGQGTTLGALGPKTVGATIRGDVPPAQARALLVDNDATSAVPRRSKRPVRVIRPASRRTPILASAPPVP